MASKWSSIKSYGNDTSITHKVGDQEVRFWPVSVKLLLELRGLIQPLSNSIAILTASNPSDTGQTFREVGSPYTDEEGKLVSVAGRLVRDTETVAEAIDPKLAMHRDKQRADAISSLLSAATDQANAESIGKIIIDSVRRGDFFDSVPTASEFMDEMTPETLIGLLTGVAKANKGVFGPLAGRFENLKDGVLGRINLEPKDKSDAEKIQTERGGTSPIKLSGSDSKDSTSDG
jgi:hypothetical protein